MREQDRHAVGWHYRPVQEPLAEEDDCGWWCLTIIPASSTNADAVVVSEIDMGRTLAGGNVHGNEILGNLRLRHIRNTQIASRPIL